MTENEENTTARRNARLMISYSRKDKVFVKQLYDSLVARGFAPDDIWVDWEGIALSADWMAEITKGIRESDAFIFVISPDSVASEVCKREIELAVESNKRFIPILYREPGKEGKLHEKISSHNWVFIRDEAELEKTMPALVAAINTDLDWIARHTRLFNKAKEWENRGRNDSYLVRGHDLQDAETFIGEGAAGKDPAPTPLHVEYVQAARTLAATIRRRTRIISAVVGVALLGLLIFSLIQWSVAITERDNADLARIAAQNSEATAVAEKARADKNAEEAFRARTEADLKGRRANASALAAESLNQRNSNSQLSLSLALLSIQETEVDKVVLDESKTALFASLNIPNVLHTWHTDDMIIWATAYDPNGKYIAFGDDDGLVHLIDPETYEEVGTLAPFGGRVSGLDFSPDGARLAVSSFDSTMRVFNLESGDEVFRVTEGEDVWFTEVDFSPNGEWLATAADNNLVKIWRAENGGFVTSYTHDGAVNAVEFSPDSSRVVSGSDDGNAVIWNLNNNSSITLPAGSFVKSVAFDPSGSRVITGGYKTVIVWDAETGDELQRLYGNRATVYDIDFAPDGRSMLTASSGLKVWDGATFTELYNLSSHNGEVNSAAFNSDGSRLITGSWDYTAKLWSTSLKIETMRFGGRIPLYSPDGQQIIFDDGRLRVQDMSGNLMQAWVPTDWIYQSAFDPRNSQRVLTVDNTNISLWEIGREEPLFVIPNETSAEMAFINPSTDQLLTVDNNGVLIIWDANTGEELSTEEGYGGRIFDARLGDGENRILVFGGNETEIWDLNATGSSPVTLFGHTDIVLAGAFSADGQFAYTGGYDNTIRKWDAQTGEELLVMTGHTGRVLDLAVSPDGGLVASASADNTARVWDVKSGKELYRYLGNTDEALTVAFSPDGEKVLTASADGIIKEFTIDFKTMLEIAGEYEPYVLSQTECQRFLGREQCGVTLVSGPPSTVSSAGATSSLISGDGSTPVTLSFENFTSFDVNIYWIDFEGNERLYGTLAPGEGYDQGTYSTHIWRVRDTDGNIVVDFYTATEELYQVLEITGEAVSGPAQPGAGTATEAPSASDSGSSTASFYTEEFDGALDDWSSFMTTGLEDRQVEAGLDGGSLFVSLSPFDDKLPRFYLLNSASEYSSVQLEVVTTNHGNNTNGVSLVCHYDGTNWYEFVVSNSGVYEIFAYDPGAANQGYIRLANGGSPAIQSGRTTNVYRVVCDGSNLSLYINDVEIAAFDDTQYRLTGGQVGIGVSSPQMLPVEVSFESFTVSEP